MKQAATVELFSYWDALRAGLDRVFLDAAPERMRALLVNTFLIEVDARRAYPLRVVGGALAKLTAKARPGASFRECWAAASQPLLEAMLCAVHDERFPVVVGAHARTGKETNLSVEILLLPLCGEPGGRPRILGGLAPAGALRQRASLAPLDIVSARVLRQPQPQPAFAPAPPAAPLVAGVHAHLRVIEGGRSGFTQV